MHETQKRKVLAKKIILLNHQVYRAYGASLIFYSLIYTWLGWYGQYTGYPHFPGANFRLGQPGCPGKIT